MTEEIKRKLEAEESRYQAERKTLMSMAQKNDELHDEFVKRLLAEKESGWSDIKVPLCLVTGRGGNSLYSLTTNCDIFTDYCKAKENAAKMGLFLRMSKWADENKMTGEDFLYCIWYKIFSFDKHWLKNGIGSDEYEKLNEKFGKEILKIWVRGEYE